MAMKFTLLCVASALTSWVAFGDALETEPAVAAAPAGVYVEARDATVWGGACHISSEAVSGGRRAALGWAFSAGNHGGVDLAGTHVVAVLEGTHNLQGSQVFGTEEVPEIRSHVWVDAPNARARDAAVAYVRSSVDLGTLVASSDASVQVSLVADVFTMEVEGHLAVKGMAIADRSCCTMQESRWYSPLFELQESVVGNPSECRFEGVTGSLERWAFEGSNSVFVARLEGAEDSSAGTQ